MTGFSHLSSGAVIAAVVANPLVSAPLAFGSHFLLDVLPHYGEDPAVAAVSRRRWTTVVLIDGLLTAGLAGYFLLTGNFTLLVIGLIAVSPDAPFVIEIIRQRVFGLEKNSKTRSAFTKFHSRIQTLERPRGWLLELVYATGFGLALFSLL